MNCGRPAALVAFLLLLHSFAFQVVLSGRSASSRSNNDNKASLSSSSSRQPNTATPSPPPPSTSTPTSIILGTFSNNNEEPSSSSSSRPDVLPGAPARPPPPPTTDSPSDDRNNRKKKSGGDGGISSKDALIILGCAAFAFVAVFAGIAGFVVFVCIVWSRRKRRQSEEDESDDEEDKEDDDDENNVTPTKHHSRRKRNKSKEKRRNNKKKAGDESSSSSSSRSANCSPSHHQRRREPFDGDPHPHGTHHHDGDDRNCCYSTTALQPQCPQHVISWLDEQREVEDELERNCAHRWDDLLGCMDTANDDRSVFDISPRQHHLTPQAPSTSVQPVEGADYKGSAASPPVESTSVLLRRRVQPQQHETDHQEPFQPLMIDLDENQGENETSPDDNGTKQKKDSWCMRTVVVRRKAKPRDNLEKGRSDPLTADGSPAQKLNTTSPSATSSSSLSSSAARHHNNPYLVAATDGSSGFPITPSLGSAAAMASPTCSRLNVDSPQSQMNRRKQDVPPPI